MELQGKRLVFLGDSLTEGAGSSAPDKRYWEQVAKQTGAVCFADGQGGTQIAPQQHPRPETEAPYLYHPFIDRVSSLPEQADVVVVFGGVNDFFQGDAPVGNMTDRTPDIIIQMAKPHAAGICACEISAEINSAIALRRTLFTMAGCMDCNVSLSRWISPFGVSSFTRS